jgi:hypothetical protein
MAILGEVLMTDRELWRQALIQVIDECIRAIDRAEPHEADSWIGLEEVIGTAQVKQLWNDDVFGPIAKALDHYCHAAQHDFDVVFDDIRTSTVKDLLLECRDRLEHGDKDYPDLLSRFA